MWRPETWDLFFLAVSRRREVVGLTCNFWICCWPVASMVVAVSPSTLELTCGPHGAFTCTRCFRNLFFFQEVEGVKCGVAGYSDIL